MLPLACSLLPSPPGHTTQGFSPTRCSHLPWFLHHHHEPRDLCTAAPQSSLEPGRNLSLPPIFQHLNLKFSQFYPHLDNFYLEEGEIQKLRVLEHAAVAWNMLGHHLQYLCKNTLQYYQWFKTKRHPAHI